MNCSFQQLVGGSCCPDKRSRDLVEDATTVPLTSYTKDITGHIRVMGIKDVDSEVNLILACASIFACPPDLKKMTICLSHRSLLGIGCVEAPKAAEFQEIWLVISSLEGQLVRQIVGSINHCRKQYCVRQEYSSLLVHIHCKRNIITSKLEL